MSRMTVEVQTRRLEDLEPSPVNARHMSRVDFQRLVKNIREDGALTSAPLVYGDRIVSGHHRVRAALEAGIEDAPVLAITSDVPEEHLKALQLSHNSLTGEDDPEVVLQMLRDMSAMEQAFAHVTTDLVDHDTRLHPSIRTPPTVKVLVEFLPEDFPDFEATVERLASVKEPLLLEDGAMQDAFLDVYFAVKEACSKAGLMGVPSALCAMAALARERLDQMDAEAARAEGEDGGPGGLSAA